MSFFKTLAIIIVAIVATSYFAPNVYVSGKNWVFDNAKGLFKGNTTSKLVYDETDYGYDYGKILGVKNCESDQDCIDAFKIDSMMCSDTGTCYTEKEAAQ